VSEKIGQLKMTAPDGKQRFTDFRLARKAGPHLLATSGREGGAGHGGARMIPSQGRFVTFVFTASRRT